MTGNRLTSYPVKPGRDHIVVHNCSTWEHSQRHAARSTQHATFGTRQTACSQQHARGNRNAACSAPCAVVSANRSCCLFFGRRDGSQPSRRPRFQIFSQDNVRTVVVSGGHCTGLWRLPVAAVCCRSPALLCLCLGSLFELPKSVFCSKLSTPARPIVPPADKQS